MKIRAIFFIIPVILLAVAIAAGSILLWRLFILSVLVLLLSYLWMRLSVRGIGGQVNKSAEFCRVGEYFDQEFSITNSGRIPVPLIEVREETDLPGYHNAAAVGLYSRRSHAWRSRVYCQHRGRYHSGLLTAIVSDPLGFFTMRRNFGEQREILVYPETVELPFFQPQSGREANFVSSPWSATGTAPDVARIREYIGGDSLRHIHWHSTAHAGKLMVKVFDPERPRFIPQNKNVWIILNLQQSIQMGVGNETTEEYGIVLAASIAKRYIASGKPVGLMAEGDQPYLFLPQTGEEHLRQMMEALALMKATGELPVDRLVAREIDRLEASSAVIIITSSASDGITVSLRNVVNRGATAIAMLLDAASFGGAMSASRTANILSATGAQVYIIRRGLEIKRALDKSMFSRHTELGEMGHSSE
jgi:uncharacterized protein (DUF58 family)